LAEDILLRMLTVKMEDINGEAYILEIRVVLHIFCKIAIIVEKDVIWHLSIDSKGTLDEFLILQKIIIDTSTESTSTPYRTCPYCLSPIECLAC
jgi:hypothetical protein